MPTDHHFPKYHLRPRRGYVNDPNGPIYVDRRWHLYFQYVYDTPRRGAVVWGHASSADLATWHYHRPAISPEPHGHDRDGCWSGNTIEVDGRVVAFYSGSRHGHPYQSVVTAASTDGGLSFGPPQAVVADPEPSENIVEFRDPFVWQHDGRWLMLVGAGDTSALASARLYESDDLTTWTYRGPFAELPRMRTDEFDTGEVWECPQLLSFGDRDALLVATHKSGPSIGKVLALTGVQDNGTLPDPRLTLVDRGPNFYAASALRDSPAGPLVWGWVTEGRTPEWAIEADWSGMISLPRAVDLTADGRLASTPPDALKALRDDDLEPSSPRGSRASQVEFDDLGAQFEVEVALEAHRGGNTAPTRLSLRCGDDEHLDLVVDWTTGQLRLDRDHASQDPRADRGVSTYEEPAIRSADSLGLRWFVDGSVCELFTSTGHCSTLRFYPTSPPPWRLEIAGLVPHDTIQVWTMRGLG
jgi:beta-fructofuranosidase